MSLLCITTFSLFQQLRERIQFRGYSLVITMQRECMHIIYLRNYFIQLLGCNIVKRNPIRNSVDFTAN